MNIDKELMKNLEQLDSCISSCKGRVVLATEDGQRIELKSRLGMCVAACIILSHGAEEKIQIEASDEDDIGALMNCISAMNQKVKFCMLEESLQ